MFRRVLVVSWFSITCSAARSPGVEHVPGPRTLTLDSPAGEARRADELHPARAGSTNVTVSTRVAARGVPGSGAALRAGTLGMPMAPNTRRCPTGMALVDDRERPFCIDRWEASLEHRRTHEPWPANVPIDGREREMAAVSRPGVTPQGYISGVQAERACENAGKRLCAREEWVHTCQGPRRTTFPYGDQRRTGACNDRSTSPPQHPVTRLFQEFAPRGTPRASMWGLEWMNDPRLFELEDTVALTGSHADCTNDYGVYDQVGNLHEWIDDRRGTFMGGYFMDTVKNGDGCSYRTVAHGLDYHDYSTGFRCCADPSSF